MRLVIIGAGNVATVLGRLFQKNGHQIIQIISKNLASGNILAAEFNCDHTNDSLLINLTADFYFIAISDKELPSIGLNYQLDNKLVVHSAGAVSKNVIKDVSTNFGVLYPLQSLRKENDTIIQNIPLLIDTNSKESLDQLQQIALTISNNITHADDELRMKLHVTAVFVSNFTNYLYELAENYCTNEGADFRLLLPLIEETAHRLSHHSPSATRTGPAARKDMETIQNHLKLLAPYPVMRKVYTNMSEQIMGSKIGDII